MPLSLYFLWPELATPNTILHPDRLQSLKSPQTEPNLKVFEVVKAPYIKDQHIGNPDSFIPKSGGYDIVYERYGPNFHTRSKDLHKRTFGFLSEGGVLSMTSTNYHEVDPTEVPFIVPIGRQTLFISKGNFLAEALGRQQERVVGEDLLNAILDGLIAKKRRGQW
ncbi:MAG: hypothetical protein WC897_02465 [Candidatus Gracilibacteria bacterium]